MNREKPAKHTQDSPHSSPATDHPTAAQSACPASVCTDPSAIELPIEGVLDLHTFRPRDVKELVPEYLSACRARGILCVRIIHGKGIGQLRQSVHAILRRMPEVVSFGLAGEPLGGWGATIVHLQPLPPPDSAMTKCDA